MNEQKNYDKTQIMIKESTQTIIHSYPFWKKRRNKIFLKVLRNK